MNIDKDIELVSNLKNVELKGKVNEQYIYAKIPEEYLNAISNVLSELEKKDNIIFETKKYLENMTKSSIRDKDGYYLGNWYVLQPYELEDVIDILKGKRK